MDEEEAYKQSVRERNAAMDAKRVANEAAAAQRHVDRLAEYEASEQAEQDRRERETKATEEWSRQARRQADALEEIARVLTGIWKDQGR